MVPHKVKIDHDGVEVDGKRLHVTGATLKLRGPGVGTATVDLDVLCLGEKHSNITAEVEGEVFVTIRSPDGTRKLRLVEVI